MMIVEQLKAKVTNKLFVLISPPPLTTHPQPRVQPPILAFSTSLS